MSRVEVLTRPACAACEAAVSAVSRICAELGVDWSTVDVDADPELRTEYGDRIPVVLVEDREHGFWTVDEARLRAALA